MPDPTIAEIAARLAVVEAKVGITPPTPQPQPEPGPVGKPAKPTGLAVTLDATKRPVLDWDPAADATKWEVHDLNNTVKTLQVTVTEPHAVRSALKAGQRRRYALIAIGPGGRSEVSDAVDVPASSGDQPTPPPTTGGAKYPGDISGPNWYLTLPTGTQGSPDTVKRPKLATYTSEFFNLTAAGDGIIFRCWHGGVTTKGSHNPRSELRETNPDGTLAWWPMRTGRHAMTVVGQVNRLTKVQPRVVLHQIHGRAADTTVWRLEGSNLYITDGDNAHGYLVTDAFKLGQRYELTTEVADGKIRYRYNGEVVPFELPAPVDDGYFKAGAYLQSNPESAPGESTSEFAETVIYNVTVTHA